MTRRTFLLTPVALAQQALAQQHPAPLISGYRLLYLLRFADARAVFLEWQRTHPSDPMGFVSEAASHLFEEFERHGVLTIEFFLDDDRLLGGIKGKADAARVQAFEKANARARAIAESGPKDANGLLVLTLAAGMQANYLSLIAKRQIESLTQISAARTYAQSLSMIAPGVRDADMALGAADYILACLPIYKRAILWFGGMHGDKYQGMDELMAARDGIYLGPYAKIMLILALVREKRVKEAQRQIHELTAAFPESPLFAREQVKIDRLA